MTGTKGLPFIETLSRVKRKMVGVVVLLKNWVIGWAGVLRYLAGGEASPASWRSFLDLHCRSNGRSNQTLSKAMSMLAPPKPLQPFQSMLGSFDQARLGQIAAQIEQNGYYVFDQRISDTLCDEIAAASMKIEAQTEVGEDGRAYKRRYDPAAPVAHRYAVAEKDAWQIPAFQEIIADPIFINVAEAYLRATPTIVSVQLWWSSIMGGRSSSEAAQLFHFDYDPAPRWLKFFVHMTDVDAGSGPHVFVRGSHKPGNPKAKEMLSRGYVRVSDEEIADVYGRENIVEFTGRRGTVLVVDTIGFHKGKAPLSHHRLIGQLVFSTPLFVPIHSQPLEIPKDAFPGLIETRTKYPWAFARYPISA